MKETTERGRVHLPVACSLSGPDLAARRRELVEYVFGGALQLEELENGYEFGFPGSTEWTEKLVEMINTERACCTFLTFELRFEPDNGPVSLRVTGPEDTRAFIETGLMAPSTG